jgi:hypothetical protein
MIVRPLSSSGTSTVIIIDALDECVDKDLQSAILSVLGRLVEGIPNVKFLITGRPEPRIQSGFRLELLRPLTDVFVLHEVEPSVINTDIQLFLEHELSELAKRRGIEQDGWPTDQDLDLLCERAAGLFVYAVATLKFLDHGFNSLHHHEVPGEYDPRRKRGSPVECDPRFTLPFEFPRHLRWDGR